MLVLLTIPIECCHPAFCSLAWNVIAFLFPCTHIEKLLDGMIDKKCLSQYAKNWANLEAIIKVFMLNSLLSVSTQASFVHTRNEDEMTFKGNYKFEYRAESKTLIIERSLPCSALKVPPNVWTLVSGLLIFELYNII